MYENTFPNKRYKHTIEFLEKYISKDADILDLGVENPFSKSSYLYCLPINELSI